MLLLKHKIYFYFFGLLYILLPLIYTVSPVLFTIVMFISFGVVFYGDRDLESIVFKIYLWSFSFFGVSILSMKLFDIIMLISLALIIIIRGRIITWNNVYVMIPFFLFISAQVVAMALSGNTKTDQMSSVYLELGRYVLCIFTVFLFLQIKIIKKINIIKWMDSFSLLVLVQSIAMFTISNTVAHNLTNVGPIQIQIFTDESESRVSAFFSDPNKMMCFFTICFLIRIIILYKHQDFHWEPAFFIYLGGAVASLARTSIIVAITFVFLYVYYRFFGYKNKILSTFILISISALLLMIILQNSTEFIGFVNNFFNGILELFGRENTVKLNTGVSSDSRVLVWKQAFTYIQNSPLFGNGLLSEERLLPIPTHNTFIQLMLDTGIFGLALYFIGVIYPLFRASTLWLVLVLVMIPMFFLDLANFRLLFVALAFAFQSYQVSRSIKGV